MKDLIAAPQSETEKISGDIYSSKTQFLINQATTMLDKYEQDFGLSTNISDTYENRRSRIISRLRGHGTSTIEFIKNLAESFKYGEVDVIENTDISSVTIKFVGALGIPPNIEDLKVALKNVWPAHLGVEYVFSYNLWNAFNSKKWSELPEITWQEAKEMEVL